MSESSFIRWAEWDGDGVQQVAALHFEGGIRFDGVAIGSGPQGHGVSFRVECDADWIVRSLLLGSVGSDSEIALTHDANGRWTLNGRAAPELDGAMEPDISVTPLTNCLPVRRLGLAAGQGADIDTVYVDVGSMRVFRDPQRYTCLEPGRLYRYESLDSDFTAEIVFAADGQVETYPGLFRRMR
jgi:uncharacterized protein